MEPESYRRWELFQEVTRGFADLFKGETLVATYDRKQDEATLALQTSRARISVQLLGSGVQQIISMIARLLMTNATFVAMEEPELSLRHTVQLRLREAFEELVRGPVNLQLFLTSHSPAFETGDHFYAMFLEEGVPRVEKRPVSEATQSTEHLPEVPGPGASAPLCYISSDGLVKVPDDIR